MTAWKGEAAGLVRQHDMVCRKSGYRDDGVRGRTEMERPTSVSSPGPWLRTVAFRPIAPKLLVIISLVDALRGGGTFPRSESAWLMCFSFATVFLFVFLYFVTQTKQNKLTNNPSKQNNNNNNNRQTNKNHTKNNNKQPQPPQQQYNSSKQTNNIYKSIHLYRKVTK